MNIANNSMKRIIKTGVVLASLLAVGGCSAHSTQHKPQQHNPHHRPSVQVMFEYDYYPDQHVYFDRHNRLYHYNHVDLGWLTVRILPEFIHLNHHKRHHLAYNHNRPWKERHVNKHHYSHHEPRHYSRHEQRHQNRYDNRNQRRDNRGDKRQHHRQEHHNERRDHRQNSAYGHSNKQRDRH